MQVVTLCISTSLVLILLGMMVFSVLTARNLSSYVKENLTVTVMLGDKITPAQAKILKRDIYRKTYTRHVTYISKEQAQREQCEAMGADPSEFLGFNPFVPAFEVQMKADYANGDSLKWIAAEFKQMPLVTDVAYQEDLMDKVNGNLRKLWMILLALAALLTFVSFSLINSSVRLSVYSRRFIIHTMKLVGASWGFIRKPFLRRAVIVGVVAAFLACVALGFGVAALYSYEPNIQVVITWRELVVTAASVFLFGLVITVFCSFISVNRFLRMKAEELYKI